MRPSVLLADDHLMVAEGLGRIISGVVDLVGTVSDGTQLLEAARRLKPDIIVTDVTMPEIGGIEVMRMLKAEGLPARFIFVTIHTEPRLAAEAMRSGASGYLLKHAAGEELLDAIQAVMNRRTYLTPLLTGDVLQRMASAADSSEPELSPRQREVLRLLAQGKRMKEIAFDLHISIRTVEHHKHELMQVLGLESNADLVRFAVRQRLIPE